MRGMAADYRQQAASTKDPDVRRRFGEMAVYCDKMAAAIEKSQLFFCREPLMRIAPILQSRRPAQGHVSETRRRRALHVGYMKKLFIP